MPRLPLCVVESHKLSRGPFPGALAPLLHSLQWLGDLGAHEVIDGDTLFLRRQVR
jgi:hypothetical protein